MRNVFPGSAPDWPSNTSYNGARYPGNGFRMPSFRTLMKCAERSKDLMGQVNNGCNTSEYREDRADSFSVSSRSTALPSCESPVSVNLDCGESQVFEPPRAQPHDFWDTVLGPPRIDSIVQNKSITALRIDALKPKPFQCHRCSLSFRKRCNLVSHVNNVHEKLRPFYCSICLRKFARKSNCSKHVSFISLLL